MSSATTTSGAGVDTGPNRPVPDFPGWLWQVRLHRDSLPAALNPCESTSEAGLQRGLPMEDGACLRRARDELHLRVREANDLT